MLSTVAVETSKQLESAAIFWIFQYEFITKFIKKLTCPHDNKINETT